MKAKKIWLLSLVAALFFLFDRLVKLYFQLCPDFSLKLAGDWLQLKLAINSGIAFGIAFSPLLIIAITFLILFFLIWFLLNYLKQNDFLLTAASLLIIAGALSNLLDRILYDYVIDYIDVPFFTVFNLADVLITGGVTIFIYQLTFYRSLDKK